MTGHIKPPSALLARASAIVLISAFAVSAFKVMTARHGTVAWRAAHSPTIRDAATDEVQDVFVLIGSSHCGYSTDPKLFGAFDRIVAANTSGHTVASTLRIGVSMDEDARRGFDWLRSVGRFDEVDIGGNWLNSDVVNLIWAVPAAPPVIPQIILIERRIHRTSQPASRLTVTDVHVVKRAVGLDHISNWVDSVKAGAT